MISSPVSISFSLVFCLLLLDIFFLLTLVILLLSLNQNRRMSGLSGVDFISPDMLHSIYHSTFTILLLCFDSILIKCLRCLGCLGYFRNIIETCFFVSIFLSKKNIKKSIWLQTFRSKLPRHPRHSETLRH